MPKIDENKGGQIALAGYLYQVLGICALKAKSLHPQRGGKDHLTDPSQIEDLLSLVRSGRMQHEAYGQDAVIHRQRQLGINEDDECILVQFKYSTLNRARVIYPQELGKILDHLQISANLASSQNEKVTGYVLITNRDLSSGASKLRNAALNGIPHKDLTDQQRQILRVLRIPKELVWDTWENDLVNFARSYGVLDPEIRNGISLLIGDTLLKTASEGTPYIEEEDLIAAFTGSKTARPLTLQSIWEHNNREIDSFARSAGISFDDLFRRRMILDQIRKQAEGHALIFLIGDGGCGKTVSALSYVQEVITSDPNTMRACATIHPAKKAKREYIPELIFQWRKLDKTQAYLRPGSEPESSLERLRLANQHAELPFLYLCLDELDEDFKYPDQGHIVSDILSWFWEKDKAYYSGASPDTTLIVTCRSEKDIKDWLRIHPNSLEQPNIVRVNNFTPEELKSELEEAEAIMPTTSYSRLLNTLRIRSEPHLMPMSGQMSPLVLHIDPFTTSVDEQMLDSLLHPVIWGEFLQLDGEDQSHFLDGKLKAKNLLAEKYIRWFCWKARNRGCKPALKEEELVKIFHCIAHSCSSGNSPRHERIDWIKHSCSTNLVSETEAGSLYREAESSGLISLDDQLTWRWRHQFVYEFLVGNN